MYMIIKVMHLEEKFPGEGACPVAACRSAQRAASCLAVCQGVVHPVAFHPYPLEAAGVLLDLLETCQEGCVDLRGPLLGHLAASQRAVLA